MKKLSAIALAVVLLPALAACNTFKGFGKDVEATGEAVEEVAQDVEDEITK